MYNLVNIKVYQVAFKPKVNHLIVTILLLSVKAKNIVIIRILTTVIRFLRIFFYCKNKCSVINWVYTKNGKRQANVYFFAYTLKIV